MDSLKDLIRKRFGSYEALGQEIGISAQAVAAIVNGQTRGASARYAVASALGVKVSDLWPDQQLTGV